MDEQPPFGPLLRRHRKALGLSQEQFAEQAQMSWRTISDLERGINQTLRPDTLRLLVDALGLRGEERAAFEAAARRPLPALPSEPHPAPASAADERAAPAAGSAPVAVHAVAAPAGRAGPARTNLPAALSSFVGRERDVAAIRAVLAEARLVTLTGSGGVGKTRLALAVGAAVLDQYADGVWLVELASLSEPALVPGTVAQALGVREEPGRALTATLADHLRDQHLLLVLDNCEHLVAACAQVVSALLRACPRLRILATSREGLDVQGERHWRVPSLSVPDPERLPPPEVAGSYEAVCLFVARAQERQPDFALTAQNARAVAQICARLDGMPLAIELAATRVANLAVAGIAARLDDRFRLLTGGARDVLPRQRTLRAALDWSYDLLTEPEQVLLDRLSVFAGGWTLAAAEAVCTGDGIEAWEVLDLLGGLVNKSLVQSEERAGGAVRYGLLETVRQYEQERLEAGGAAGVRNRHLGWCVALAEEAEPHVRGAEQGTWLDRLETEHDNLRAALRWARTRGATEEGLRVAAALWRFWLRRGHLSEGRGWLADLLNAGEAFPAVRVRALDGAGILACDQGAYAQALSWHEESLALARELGDPVLIAATLNSLGNVAKNQGDYARAMAWYEESLALRRQAGDMRGLAVSLGNMGNMARRQGNYAQARAWHEESLALERELGDKSATASSLNNLGAVAYDMDDYALASILHQESLVLRRELGDKFGVPTTLRNLGQVRFAQGDYAAAHALYEESLALARELGDKPIIAVCLEGLAAVAAAEGQAGQAAPHSVAAEALREAIGAPMPTDERAPYARCRDTTRAALGEDAFAATWAEGRAMPLDEALTLALEGRAAVSRGQ